MRKGRDGGEKNKIKTFLVATNVVASRPLERQPTGTLTAFAIFQMCRRAHTAAFANPPFFGHSVLLLPVFFVIQCSVFSIHVTVLILL